MPSSTPRQAQCLHTLPLHITVPPSGWWERTHQCPSDQSRGTNPMAAAILLTGTNPFVAQPARPSSRNEPIVPVEESLSGSATVAQRCSFLSVTNEPTAQPPSAQSARNEANGQHPAQSHLHGTYPLHLLRTKSPTKTVGTNPKVTTSSSLCAGSKALLTLRALPLSRNEPMYLFHPVSTGGPNCQTPRNEPTVLSSIRLQPEALYRFHPASTGGSFRHLHGTKPLPLVNLIASVPHHRFAGTNPPVPCAATIHPRKWGTKPTASYPHDQCTATLLPAQTHAHWWSVQPGRSYGGTMKCELNTYAEIVERSHEHCV